MEEAAQLAKEQRSHERYVEELVGPDDYWMTLTDSARATRRQEVTIRRWVARGELPVRRYRVGLNKRSRQVRASDLAKLTPIIDTSAMISGEEGQLNLINIPGEQAAIRTEQQRLFSEATALRGALADYKQDTELALIKHQENWIQALDTAQALFNHQFAQNQQAIEQVRTELLERLSRQEETGQQQLEQLQAALTAQGEQFQEAFQAYRREVEGMLAELRHETKQRLETLEASLTQANETLAHRMETLEHALQEQGVRHRQEMQTMREHLRQEQGAMAQQVAALATQLAEHQLQQEQEHHQLQEQLTQLQEQFAAPARPATTTRRR